MARTVIYPEFSQHLFLTGFMGSGKSTLGKKLAPLLNLPFIDLDIFIEKKENTSIASIFEAQGETAFREKETSYLTEIAALPPAVVALGGGTVCFGNNLKLIKQQGLLIYLELPAAVLASRISNSRHERPLLKGLSGEALLQAIDEKLAQRTPYYTQAQLTVNALGLTAPALKTIILESDHHIAGH